MILHRSVGGQAYLRVCGEVAQGLPGVGRAELSLPSQSSILQRDSSPAIILICRTKWAAELWPCGCPPATGCWQEPRWQQTTITTKLSVASQSDSVGGWLQSQLRALGSRFAGAALAHNGHHDTTPWCRSQPRVFRRAVGGNRYVEFENAGHDSIESYPAGRATRTTNYNTVLGVTTGAEDP
eukprot:scaffold952_cov409-Prasinococcus_capsulatus_cf.AAC.43